MGSPLLLAPVLLSTPTGLSFISLFFVYSEIDTNLRILGLSVNFLAFVYLYSGILVPGWARASDSPNGDALLEAASERLSLCAFVLKHCGKLLSASNCLICM